MRLPVQVYEKESRWNQEQKEDMGREMTSKKSVVQRIERLIFVFDRVDTLRVSLILIIV